MTDLYARAAKVAELYILGLRFNNPEALAWADEAFALIAELDAALTQAEKQTDYSIALQRAIEYRCRNELVPPDIAALCPHHAAKLNALLMQEPEATAGEYTQGICADGAAILCDGEMITIEEVLRRLNSLHLRRQAP